MRYRVFVSNGEEYKSLYTTDNEEARLLFNMAKNSGMFTYAAIYKVVDESHMITEWFKEDEYGNEL